MSQIDPRVHRVLDGEAPATGLNAVEQRQVAALQRAAQLLSRAPGTSVAERVMTQVRRPRPGGAERLARWLTGRQAVTVTFRPVWSLALAAVVVAVALVPGHGRAPLVGAREGIAQFVGRFPGARSVEVVGSFTNWRAGALPLRDEDHDGVWRGSVVLPVGQHEYMFVVDGERWVSDPLAERYVDDGFGRRNALIFVRPLYR